LDRSTKSKIRSRIEHIFGVQAERAGNLLLRTVGIARARVKIGLRNLTYNIDRMGCFWLPAGKVRPASDKMAKECHRNGTKPIGLIARKACSLCKKMPVSVARA